MNRGLNPNFKLNQQETRNSDGSKNHVDIALGAANRILDKEQKMEQELNDAKIERYNDERIPDCLNGRWLDVFMGRDKDIVFNDEAKDRKFNPISDSKKLMVVYVDADNLKFINDQYGHEKGNIMIENVLGSLNEALPDDVVMHPHGDEFLALSYNDDPNVSSEAFEATLNAQLAQKMVREIPGEKFGAAFSFGAELFDLDNMMEKLKIKPEDFDPNNIEDRWAVLRETINVADKKMKKQKENRGVSRGQKADII